MGQYINSRYGTRQSLASNFDTNVDATGICAQFKLFSDALVREVRVHVVTAATSADTHALDVYKGTASIGSITLGTETSGVVLDATLTDTTFASTDALAIKTTDSDATFLGVVQVDYNETFNNSN